MLRGGGRDARIGEPPLQLARARAIEAELDRAETKLATRLARNDNCMSSSSSKRRPRKAARSRRNSLSVAFLSK